MMLITIKYIHILQCKLLCLTLTYSNVRNNVIKTFKTFRPKHFISVVFKRQLSEKVALKNADAFIVISRSSSKEHV